MYSFQSIGHSINAKNAEIYKSVYLRSRQTVRLCTSKHFSSGWHKSFSSQFSMTIKLPSNLSLSLTTAMAFCKRFFCTENMNQINKRHSMVKHIKHKTSCMKLSSTRFVVTELFFSKSAFVMFGVKKEHTLLRFYVKCNKTSPLRAVIVQQC